MTQLCRYVSVQVERGEFNANVVTFKFNIDPADIKSAILHFYIRNTMGFNNNHQTTIRINKMYISSTRHQSSPYRRLAVSLTDRSRWIAVEVGRVHCG